MYFDVAVRASNVDFSDSGSPTVDSGRFKGDSALDTALSLMQLLNGLVSLREKIQSSDQNQGKTEEPSDDTASQVEWTLAGDELGRYLTASGGDLRKDDGVWGVAGGRQNDEIDLGESITFSVPSDMEGEVTGARVAVDKLYRYGKDGDFIERAQVIAYDAEGAEVGHYQVEGERPYDPGHAYINIDKPFTSLEFQPLANGAGHHSDNSDFAIRDVTLFTETASDEESVTDEGTKVAAAPSFNFFGVEPANDVAATETSAEPVSSEASALMMIMLQILLQVMLLALSTDDSGPVSV